MPVIFALDRWNDYWPPWLQLLLAALESLATGCRGAAADVGAQATALSYFPPIFPASWTRLRDQGRLQFSRLQRSGLWHAAFPELGEEKYARERHELTPWINACIARLPQVAQPQPVNGHDHEPLPAHRNLLPRR